MQSPRFLFALATLMVSMAAACSSTPEPAAPQTPPQTARASASSGEATSLQKGVKAIQQQEFERAKQELSTAVSERPSDAQAHYYLGVAQHALGELSPAVESFRTSVKLEPQLLEARINLGAALLDAGDATAALEVTEAALKRFEQQPQLTYNRALALMELKRFIEAAEAYAAAAKAQPDAAEIRFGYAQALVAAGKPEAGREQLLSLLSSKDVAVLASAARLLARMKDFKSCIVALDAALGQQASPELLVERGLCKHALGLEEAALNDYRAAAQAGPDFAPAHYYLGMHLRAEKDYREARAALQKALELAGSTQLGAAAKKALSQMASEK